MNYQNRVAIQIIAVAIILIFLICIIYRPVWEFLISTPYYLGPSYNTVDSGSPVPYGQVPNFAASGSNNAIYLRRFRTAIPTGPGARQITDDTWARQYQPGIGLQLGEEYFIISPNGFPGDKKNLSFSPLIYT